MALPEAWSEQGGDIRLTAVTEVPLDAVPSLNATKLSADGAVVGSNAGDAAWRWVPGSPAIEDLGGSPAFGILNLMPLVAADGSFVANNRMEEDDEFGFIGVPSTWRESEGWAPLPNLNMGTSIMLAISTNGAYFTGRGRNEAFAEDVPWIWDAKSGQQTLDLLPGMEMGEGHGVSNDGRIMIGTQGDLKGSDPWRPLRNFASRWVDGKPQILHDGSGEPLGQAFACSEDCSVVVGGRRGGEPDLNDPQSHQAWYWNETDGGVYLGTLPDAAEFQPYYATDVNGDGNVIIGTYYIVHEDGQGFAFTTYRGFIWTEKTGLVSVSDLLDGQGRGGDADDWYDMVPSGITPDGSMVLITGNDRDFMPRAWVLHLEFEEPEDLLFQDRFEH